MLVSDKLPEVRKVDGKYDISAATFCYFGGKARWVIAMESGTYRYADSLEALKRGLDAREAEVAAEVARNNAAVEFKEEVVAAMMEAGIARHVALNRISTVAKLMAEAKAFGVI